jgi:hypothetical protein
LWQVEQEVPYLRANTGIADAEGVTKTTQSEIPKTTIAAWVHRRAALLLIMNLGVFLSGHGL